MQLDQDNAYPFSWVMSHTIWRPSASRITIIAFYAYLFTIGIPLALLRLVLLQFVVLLRPLYLKGGKWQVAIASALKLLLGARIKGGIPESVRRAESFKKGFVIANHIHTSDFVAEFQFFGVITANQKARDGYYIGGLRVQDLRAIRKDTFSEIVRSTISGENGKPTLLFPEGATTGFNRAVLKFAPAVFQAAGSCSFFPIRLTNTNPFNIQLGGMRLPMALIALMNYALPWQTIEIEYLGEHRRNEDESCDDFVERMRRLVAGNKLALVPFDRRDKGNVLKGNLSCYLSNVRAMASAGPQQKVVFDFDGTLVNTNLAELFWHLTKRVSGWKMPFAFFIALIQSVIIIACHKLSSVKLTTQTIIWLCLRGWNVDELNKHADTIMKEFYYSRLNFASLDQLMFHLNRGDDVVISSGSPKQLIAPFLMSLRIPEDRIVGTTLEIDAESGQVLGAKHLNLDEDKLPALAKIFGSGIDYAYTDSINDLPLLLAAKTPVCINPCKRLAAEADRRMWTVVHGSGRSYLNKDSGELVFIMGPSGCGKTTLLDTLCSRRQPGQQLGTVSVTNLDIGCEIPVCNSVYVQQDDVFFPNLTPFEHLMFNYLERGGGKNPTKTVNNCLQLVNLADVAHQPIGGVLPGGIAVKGLSGGQRRRLSVAAALLVEPDIILLDEPTSGLDSHNAEVIISVCKNIAKTNCIVFCVIHQPSTAVYKSADRVILLGKDITGVGRVIENLRLTDLPEDHPMQNPTLALHNAIEFENQPIVKCMETPRISRALTTRPTIKQEGPAEQTDWKKPELPRRRSSFYVRLRRPAAKMFQTCVRTLSLQTNTFMSTYLLFRRSLTVAIRSPVNFLARFGSMCVFGLLLGTLFANADMKNKATISSLIFPTLISLQCLPFGSIATFQDMRIYYVRERNNKLYRQIAFAAAMIALEILIACVCGVTMVSIIYGIAARSLPALAFIGIGTIFHVVSNLFILAVSVWTENATVGFSIAAAATSIMQLYAGFFIPIRSVPVWLRWLSRISFTRYAMDAFVAGCTGDGELAKALGLSGDLKEAIVCLCVFIVGFSVVCYHGLDRHRRGRAS